METSTKLSLGALVVGLIAIFTALHAPGVITKEVTHETQVRTGSVASPDIMSPYISVGGLQTYYARTTTLNAGTNTPCTIQSPSSTSTLALAVIKLDVSSSSASQVVIGKGTSMTATTTLLSAVAAIGANGQASVYASTTNMTDANIANYVLAPNTWINFNMVPTGTGVGTESPSGSCLAEFIVH